MRLRWIVLLAWMGAMSLVFSRIGQSLGICSELTLSSRLGISVLGGVLGALGVMVVFVLLRPFRKPVV